MDPFQGGYAVRLPRSVSHDNEATLPSDHLAVLQRVSISFALTSFLSTLFSFYWFVRMRRGFRHE